MPPPLSTAEKRLATFCRFFAAAYLAGAAIFAFAPALSYRLAAGVELPETSAEALFWNALGVSSMVAAGVACLVVASDVRARRHALLPVIAAKLSASLVAVAHLQAGRALGVLFTADLAVCLLTLAAYRTASPGVHLSQSPQERVPQADEAPAAPVQLGVPK